MMDDKLLEFDEGSPGGNKTVIKAEIYEYAISDGGKIMVYNEKEKDIPKEMTCGKEDGLRFGYKNGVLFFVYSKESNIPMRFFKPTDEQKEEYSVEKCLGELRRQGRVTLTSKELGSCESHNLKDFESEDEDDDDDDDDEEE